MATIPALDKIYGEDTRMSLQGGAGVKIYLAPADPRTKAELSAAVGKTTHRVTSRSKTIGKGPFSGVNVSERTEDRDLLSEDEAGRLDKDTVIVLANGQHPIKATRIKYFEDRVLNPIFQAQKGPLPAPDPKDLAIRDLQGDLVRAVAQIDDLSNQVQTIAQQRSRIVSDLFCLKGLISQVQNKENGGDNSGSSRDAINENIQEPRVPKRMRKVNMSIRPDDLVGSGDDNVRALIQTTVKVDKITPDDDGAAVAAAE
ncbi:Type VI secretion protein [Pleodorina starrii]|uniref:Type VI secretion protein n=1 Tax=Pleodorina starrii TaxID=330485 RepID=A0A9W6C2M9_9CHLO|nr:Type VI secretion protein [Pleodorina starrii]